MKKQFFCILTLCIICLNYLSAQQYPVQVGVQVMPPYSVYLSDYASAVDEKLAATILLTDINQSDLQVKLRISILGDGITIQTTKNFTPTPIHISGGTATRISGVELASYLDPMNLDFQGLSKNDFLKTGKLPEGIYQFCVEVLEYRRGALISNKGVAIAWLILNDPPRWTIPQPDAKLTASDPQNIFFSWMPMHTGSPNAAFSTEYEFTMVEIWPADRNPNDAINTTIPFIKTTTRLTNLLVGPADPPLVPGRRYACRIKAFDVDGKDMFKNHGYSEALSFTFGDACKIPLNINHTGINSFQEQISWDPLFNHTSFVLHYREQTASGFSEWYEDMTTDNPHIIKNLKAEKTYEYQIKAICETVSSDYSASQMFTTMKTASTQVNCDNTGGITPPDNSPAIATLKVGDVINVGGFNATITEVTGSNGTFSGKCIVDVTTFGVKVKSHFTNISVNQSKQVTAGEIVADRNELRLLDADQFVQNVKDEASYIQGILGDDPTLAGIILQMDKDNTLSPEAKEALQKIDEGKKMVAEGERLMANGNTAEGQAMIEQGQKMIAEGKQVLKETAGMKVDKLKNQLVTFNAASNQTYGFDRKQYQTLASFYESYFDNGKEYSFPWKALAINSNDNVIATVDKNTDAKNIVFRDNKGNTLTPTSEKNNMLLSVPGDVSDMSESEVLAYKVTKGDDNKDSEETVGKLKTVSYKLLNPKLTLISVNGAKASIDITMLNKIYSQAVVNWQLGEVKNFTIDNWDLDKNSKFDDGENEFLSNYTTEMNNLIDAYKQANPNIEKESYYLFMLPFAPSTSGKMGQMPLKSTFGFIFTTNYSTEQITHTAAHELGHGAFRLQHPFTEYPALLKSSTDNLMDYTNNTALYKYQWDNIHDPAWGLYLGQSESEGALLEISNLIEAIRNANLKELKTLQLIKDKCEQTPYKIYKIGNKTLSYIHIACGDLLENTEIPFETMTLKSFDWNAKIDAKSIFINPSEVSKVNSIGTKNGKKYIRYQFHELKYSDKSVELPQLTDNVLFHFLVLESEAEDFEEYLFPKLSILISGISWKSQYDSEIKNLTKSYPPVPCTYTSSYKTCCNSCCRITCFDILTKANYKPNYYLRITTATYASSDDYKSGLIPTNFEASINMIDKNLKNNRPVIVGVNWNPITYLGNQFNPATYHYIVLIGKEFSKSENMFYYIFHEVGTSIQNTGDGYINNNYLYIDEVEKKIEGKQPYNLKIKYTITEIFDNDPN